MQRKLWDFNYLLLICFVIKNSQKKNFSAVVIIL